MAHNYFNVTFGAQAQAAANGVHRFTAPVGLTLVNVSFGVEALTGSPTNVNIDIQDDTNDVITAITRTSAGVAEWVSTHFGGSETPVAIAEGSVLEVDVNFSGGSSPTADYDVLLTFLAGTV